MNKLFMAGLSHLCAPIEVREKVAIPSDSLREVLAELKATEGVHEAMLVSTCNRVELYVMAEGPEAARRFFSSRAAAAEGCLYEKRALDAARHLFRVSASLDSMVVGEQQILGQVKEAYGIASGVGAAGPVLSRLCNRAFATAKRVRTETEIGRGASSMSQVAVELVAKIFGDLHGRPVLLVGAGKMGTLSAKALASLGASRVLVTNRSSERAAALAEQTGGEFHEWARLPDLLVAADVAIVSTGAPDYVITRELVTAAMKARRQRTLCLIDISVPRNIDPRCSELPEVYAYDVDDLQRVIHETRAAREGEAIRAEAIVEAEAMAFAAERELRAALPVLAALRKRAEGIASVEAEKTLAQLGDRLDEKGRRSVEAMARAIVNKLLHGPTTRLKAAASSGDSELPGAAAALFGLDPEFKHGAGGGPPIAGEGDDVASPEKK